jgi:hypothetical protein
MNPQALTVFLRSESAPTRKSGTCSLSTVHSVD